MLSELFASVSAKAAAASFVAVTTAGTGVAAATGSLPADLQDGVSRAAASVGIELPDGGQDVSADEVRQDSEHRQDEGRKDMGDEVLDTLSDVDPTEDGEGFGEDVSDKATTDGEGLGEDVSGTASDGASDQGQTSTTGDEASTAGDDASTAGDGADEEADVSGDYKPEDPSSGDQDGDSNAGSEHRSG